MPGDHTAKTQKPFGLGPAPRGATLDKWHSLQPVLRVEAQVLSHCQAEPQSCPPEAARFLAIVDTGRALKGRARIGIINRAVNLAIRPMSDLAQFGVPDVWQTPLMTFSSGAGDCEDYAIAKFVALRDAGISAEDLRLIIVHDRRWNEDHAVVAVRDSGDWLILDNRTMRLLTDRQVADVTPLMSLAAPDDNPPPIAVAKNAGTEFAQLETFGP